jgi:hypothetical protein
MTLDESRVRATNLRAMCGRPLDAREKVRNLTGWSIAIMCPAFSTRRHVRWPRWGPRSSPKQHSGFESRCTERVLWIVSSTDRHLIQALSPRHQRAVPADTG